MNIKRLRDNISSLIGGLRTKEKENLPANRSISSLKLQTCMVDATHNWLDLQKQLCCPHNRVVRWLATSVSIHSSGGTTLVCTHGSAFEHVHWRAQVNGSIGIVVATAVVVGGYHTCALLSGSTVQCWGRNKFGQLGDGTTTDWWTAVTVSSLTYMKMITDIHVRFWRLDSRTIVRVDFGVVGFICIGICHVLVRSVSSCGFLCLYLWACCGRANKCFRGQSDHVFPLYSDCITLPCIVVISSILFTDLTT